MERLRQAEVREVQRASVGPAEVLRAGMKDKLMPVRFLAEKIPGQCEGIISADPFLMPTKKYPENSEGR